MSQSDQFVAISDPGEIGREEHNWGDRIVVAISNLFSWIYPILMLAIVAQVILRQTGNNQAWLDDLQWWLYGSAVMIGIGYAVTTDSHVRVDIFYANHSDRKRALTDVFALAWLFLPFILLAWDQTLHYAISSVEAMEGSDSPNGLHNLWILKIFLNVSFLFIAFAVWGAYVRRLDALTEPELWKQLLCAFPAVMFMVNLAIYYGLYWVIRLTAPEEVNVNRITREPPFEPVLIAGFELLPTVMASLVATVLVILLAWLLRKKTV